MADLVAQAVQLFNAGQGRDLVLRTPDGVAISLGLLAMTPNAATELLQGLRQSGALRVFEGAEGRRSVIGDLPGGDQGFVILATIAQRLGFDLDLSPKAGAQ